GIGVHDAEFLVASDGLDYFQELLGTLEAGAAVEWFRFLVRMASGRGRDYQDVKPRWLSKIASAGLTDYAKKGLVLEALEEGREPEIREPTADMEAVVERVIRENPGPVEQYLAGDARVLNFLVGRGMAHSKGALDPREMRAAFKERLGKGEG
ncbi:MAG: hypothetical protein GXO65_06275, partial [Euryarchaeota archaeon]|nr:hypothetical protein [Euryarchaeota archaeon]